MRNTGAPASAIHDGRVRSITRREAFRLVTNALGVGDPRLRDSAGVRPASLHRSELKL